MATDIVTAVTIGQLLLYHGHLHYTGSVCILLLIHSESNAVDNFSRDLLLILNFWKIKNPTCQPSAHNWQNSQH